MTGGSSQRRLRLPVRYVDGVWESAYGGIVPVHAFTTGELIIDPASISDPAFLKRMRTRSKFKILEQGAKLLVSLSIKEWESFSEEQAKLLIPFGELRHRISLDFIGSWSASGLHFVPVRLGPPDKRQARRLETETGGLWLLTEGPHAKGLLSTQVILPEGVSDEPVASLNHAFTVLSEIFEPWRISHTGNIYSRVLYQEKNGQWYPLDTLRDAAMDKNDKAIANALWEDFMTQMKPDLSSPTGS